MQRSSKNMAGITAIQVDDVRGVVCMKLGAISNSSDRDLAKPDA